MSRLGSVVRESKQEGGKIKKTNRKEKGRRKKNCRESERKLLEQHV
jgi:hypothetical protein